MQLSDTRKLFWKLIGAVSLTKNAEIDKCKYSGYRIGFDRHGFYSHHSGGTGRNVIILE